MNCELITKHLMSWCSERMDIVLPNYFLGLYECDLYKVNYRNGYQTEYEIKVSRADYFKDFKKAAHVLSRKHDLVQQGKRTNRFFFVVPDGMIKTDEVPAHAGLIYASPGPYGQIRFETVKHAKLLHKKPLPASEYVTIAHKLAAREAEFRYKLRVARSEINMLTQTR